MSNITHVLMNIRADEIKVGDHIPSELNDATLHYDVLSVKVKRNDVIIVAKSVVDGERSLTDFKIVWNRNLHKDVFVKY